MKVAEVKQVKSRILYDKVFWGLTTVKTVPDAGCWMHQNDTGYWMALSSTEYLKSRIACRGPAIFFSRKKGAKMNTRANRTEGSASST